MIFAFAGDVMPLPPPSLVVHHLVTTNDIGNTAASEFCSLSSLLISSFSRWSCCLCMALCYSSDYWESYPDGLVPNDRELVCSPTQWCLHAAAFYDRLAHRMCFCPVALSCTHCDVDIVNQMLQVRRIGYQTAVALSSPMLQITADVPMSDIIIGLTLLNMVAMATPLAPLKIQVAYLNSPTVNSTIHFVKSKQETH